ncbi:MAG: glycosyltransferase family 4 protein [Candidatus Omnitrophica bacterium]|nr:glycosyltransferase family 4 protein [Candidatus Omnitrophota bacterium]
MNVLHLVGGELTGGAAKGAYSLHSALRKLGVNSKILTSSQVTLGDKDVISITDRTQHKIIQEIRAGLDRNLSRLYPGTKNAIFSTGLVGFNFTKTSFYQQAEILHLHWINAGFVNIKSLCKVRKPIVWTLRDMWPMTGGCHHSLGCQKYKVGCGYCPQLGSRWKYDLSRWVFNRKKKFLHKSIKLVAISPWLADRARESALFRDFDILTIFNNIDTSEFYPLDKNLSRKILGIDTRKKVVLTGAINWSDIYKGSEKFLAAARNLDKNQYFLCFFGHTDETWRKQLEALQFESKHFGYLHDHLSLRLLYSCADVFVAPSLVEAFGKTLVEAMACGTPVVCFDATGPGNIVSHKIDGYKAKAYDTTDLARGVIWVTNYPLYHQLGRNAREKAIREFDSLVIARKYIELYRSLLENQA